MYGCEEWVTSLSRVRLFATPWTVAYHAPPSMGFSRQEYWSGLPFPSPEWMWGLDHKEDWVPKNWCFWTVILKKTLEVPWIARRSNQSILKEINPEYLLEELMLKLKLQSFGCLMWRAHSFRAGGEGCNGGWDGWMVSLTQWTWVWANFRR